MRPQLVINDPTVSASQPMPELAASAANALAHAIEGAVTGVASPVPTMAAIRAAVLLAESEGLQAHARSIALRLGQGIP